MRYLLAICAVLLSLFASVARSADVFDLTKARAAEQKREYDSLKKDIANRKWFDKVAKQTLRPESLIIKSDRDPADVVLRRTAGLLKHLSGLDKAPNLDAEAKQLTALTEKVAKTPAGDTKARYECYAELCKLRRRIAFANPLLNFDKVTFLTHKMAYYGHICDQYIGHNQRIGGGVHILQNPFSDKPKVQNLLDGVKVTNGPMKGKGLTGGSFISLELSFDAKTMLFAWTQAAAPEGPQHPHCRPGRVHPLVRMVRVQPGQHNYRRRIDRPHRGNDKPGRSDGRRGGDDHRLVGPQEA
jgi:hypothetical protein